MPIISLIDNMPKRIIEIEWNGFVAQAMNSYPKESCGMLYAYKPYTDEEYFFVIPCNNIAENPEEMWVPSKSDVVKARKLSRDKRLTKIGNVHSHPFPKGLEITEDNTKQLVQPSDSDLKYAKKFGDVVRIILLVNEDKVLASHVHDQYGNNIPCILNQRK